MEDQGMSTMKYRKKPIVVEAFQMTEERRWDNSDWPEWLHRAWQVPHFLEGSFFCDLQNTERIYLFSLERCMEVSYDDYIIQGIEGELYPCKPDIFEATYEEVK